MGELELKPCPFCGGEVRFDVRPERLAIAIKHNNYCINNAVSGHIYGAYTFDITADEYKTILEYHKEKLAERWNKRF